MKKIILLFLVIMSCAALKAQKRFPISLVKSPTTLEKGIINPETDSIEIFSKKKNDPELEALKDSLVVYLDGVPATPATKTDKNAISVVFKGDSTFLFINIKEKFKLLDTGFVLVLAKVKKDGNIGQAIYNFKIVKETKQGPGTKEEKPTPSVTELIACTGLNFGLDNIVINKECCCGDDENPCDDETKKCSEKDGTKSSDKYNKNRIVFYADPAEIVYYNFKGRKQIIDGSWGNKNIAVRSVAPLTFEVRNVNPEAFEVSIADSLHRENPELSPLLQQLLIDMPEKLSGSAKFGADGTNEKKKCNVDLNDSMFVAIYLITESLDGFLKQLSVSCPNKHNAYIAVKLKAKEAIDMFVKTKFAKYRFGFLEMLAKYLDPKKKADSILLTTLKTQYLKISAGYYRFQTTVLVPSDINKVEFKVNILARKNTPYLNLVKDKSIDAYVVDTWRPEVSSGLYYAWFNNDNYVLRADSVVGRNVANTQDSVLKRGNRLFKGNPGNGEFGFASFIHYSYRVAPAVSFSFNIGAGISLSDKPKTRYFAGAGIVLGKEARLALSGGAAFGNVEEFFKDRYSIDPATNDYKWLPLSETNIDYNKRFVIKPFISLTYKLPFAKKKDKITVENPADASGKKDAPKADTAKKNTTNATATSAGASPKPAQNNSSTNENGEVKTLFEKAKKIKFKKH